MLHGNKFIIASLSAHSLAGFNGVFLLILAESEWASPTSVRDKLKKAIASKDISALQSVIEEAEEAALPELSSDLVKARDTLESLGGGRGG